LALLGQADRSLRSLGAVLLEAGKLYEAAGEFEWARKLSLGSSSA
jgi:hypothetical protein